VTGRPARRGDAVVVTSSGAKRIDGRDHERVIGGHQPEGLAGVEVGDPSV
jgi:hypothetical protein